jgi:ferredoxin
MPDPPDDRTTESCVARPSRNENLTERESVFLEAFEDEAWHAETLPCLGCGICAYTCPSCHCFDLVEEGGPTCGTRLKVWDCCAFSNFTVHASGHNPRSDQAARYRQRLLHKLAYFPQKWGPPMCVGCGRCVEHCPVSMDIYEVAHAVLKHAGGEA